MKLYCARDMDGDKSIWARAPRLHRVTGNWRHDRARPLICDNRMPGDTKFIRAMFPRGVKKGQCVVVEVKRFETLQLLPVEGE